MRLPKRFQSFGNLRIAYKYVEHSLNAYDDSFVVDCRTLAHCSALI